MILTYKNLESGNLICTQKKFLVQLASKFPSIKDIVLIETILKTIEDALLAEVSYLRRNGIAYKTERCNTEIMSAVERMLKMNDPGYSMPADGDSFKQYYYANLKSLWSGKEEELASYFYISRPTKEAARCLQKQAPEIAELTRFLLELKKEVIKRCIQGEGKEEDKKRSPTIRNNTVKAREATTRWGTFYAEDATTRAPSAITINAPEI